jgi:hypothetical protein
MNANVWDNSTSPYPMLDALKDTPLWDEGKVRLFACWCVRQVWDLLPDGPSRRAVEVAERFAVGRADTDELAAAAEAAEVAAFEATEEAADWAAAEAAGAAAWAAATGGTWTAGAAWEEATGTVGPAGAAAHAGAAMAALAGEAAGQAAEAAQADKLREMFNPLA